MTDIENPFREDREQSPGEAEVETGGWLVKGFRLFRVRMYTQADVRAVQRTGELLARWARQFVQKGN